MSAIILLVEDNDANAYLAGFLLERHGFRVLRARNGREAVQLAAREEPDLILMDLQMPEMDGYEAARAIRERPGRQPPIVAVTSYALFGDREKALQSGFSDYIEKPIETETFVAQISQYLSQAGRP